MVDRKKEGLIPFIERKAGLKFERIGAPQPQDMARVAADRAVTAVRVRSNILDFELECLQYPPECLQYPIFRPMLVIVH